MAVEMVIGSGYAIGTSMQSPYADGGFEPATVTASYSSENGYILHYVHTFTNGSGGNRSVREVGIRNEGEAISSRVVLSIDAMPNFCIVPDGVDVGIEWYRDLRTTAPGSVRATLDTSGFNSTAPIHFNAVTLPNASIRSIKPAYGSGEWEFLCYTDNYADIEALQIYAAPIQTGVSLTGLTYVVSAYLPGTLKIKNFTTRIWDAYDRCYINGAIDITPFGSGWWFVVRIIRSAYNAQ